MTIISESAVPVPLPAGDYAIVELFGHVTLVGRVSEVEKFGVKLLAIEPLFQDTLLPVIFHGGAAIYRFTPCETETAREYQPRHGWQLPAAIRCVVPPRLLGAPEEPPAEPTESEAPLPF